MSRIAVAMSGGVDSSVAAMLLRDAGEPVMGLSLRLYDRPAAADRPAGGCCAPADLLDARTVADTLGIPFYVLDMGTEFRDEVIAPFAAEYRAGRTPVPCIACNSGPKFRHLMDRATAFGAGRMATGHYARIDGDPLSGRFRLLRALDRARDQSYFLFEMTQEQLARTVFPVGRMRKEEVRACAERGGLRTCSKPDSQDICFVAGGDYLDVVRRECGDAGPAGEVVDTTGRVLGRHAGIARFTIGQRRGLGLAAARPLYVVGLDAAANRVVVGGEAEQYARELVAARANWVSIPEPTKPITASVRIRSTHGGAEATIEPLGGGRFHARFRERQRAITPGQAAVLYDGDLVLGGGYIASAVA